MNMTISNNDIWLTKCLCYFQKIDKQFQLAISFDYHEKIVWKWHNFFCFCYVPTFTSAMDKI